MRLRVARSALRAATFGRWFSHLATRNRQLILALLLTLATPVANACTVCYGNPDSPLTKGSDNAVLFMLGVIGFVQVGFVGLFVTFWRRARALKRRRESLRLLEGGHH